MDGRMSGWGGGGGGVVRRLDVSLFLFLFVVSGLWCLWFSSVRFVLFYLLLIS